MTTFDTMQRDGRNFIPRPPKGPLLYLECDPKCPHYIGRYHKSGGVEVKDTCPFRFDKSNRGKCKKTKEMWR